MTLQKHKQNKGAALLTVLVAVLILTLMTLELQYTSMVEQRLAYNDLNQLQAYYLAKSGTRIGMLRLGLYARAKKIKDLTKMFPGIDMKPLLDSIWNLPLPAFPPSAGTLQKLDKPDKDAAEKVLEETKVSEGQTTHIISSEGSKINLNFLELPAELKDKPFNFTEKPTNLVEYVAMMLVNLLEGFIRESEHPSEEYPDLRPTELVGNIIDWVNSGNSRVNGGDKDQYYLAQVPPYKAKRGRFFSLEELKLVRGMDDHLFAKLRPHVTVFSYEGRINLNTASDKMIRALYPDFTEDDMKRIREKKTEIQNWASAKAFVDFVTKELGRSGFQTLYSDEKNYPFTVSSNSFIIESAGFIKKAKTQIQKTIRVGITLTQGKGGQFDNSITDPTKCDGTKGKFWYKSAGKCATKPTNEKECVNQLAGGWRLDPASNKYGCYINNQSFIFPDPNVQQEEPNAMKVLYWQEV